MATARTSAGYAIDTDDVPSAGTPCATCQSTGHFCPAKFYFKGTDVGMCEPCSREKACPVLEASEDGDEDFVSGEIELVPSSPKMEVPKAPVASPMMSPEKHPDPTRSGTKWGGVIDKLLRLEEGGNCVVSCGHIDQKRFANQLRSMLHLSTSTMYFEWGVQTFGVDRGYVQVSRGKTRQRMTEYVREEQTTTSKTETVRVVEMEHIETPRVAEITGPKEPENPVNITLSRAFEMVTGELQAQIDNISNDPDPDLQEGIKADQQALDCLRGWHPANMGFAASAKPSIYALTLERTENELRIINLELNRLQKRKGALEPILKALKDNIDAEDDTRQ